MKLLFIDVETTGLDKTRSGIHQISGYIEIDGVVKEEFNFEFKPFDGCIINPEALATCNLTEDDILSRSITEPEIYNCLLQLMDRYVFKFDKKDKFFFVGYNAHFDKDFMYEFFVRNGNNFFFSYVWGNHIDVMVLTSVLLMEQRALLQNFKLSSVACALGLSVDVEKLHDAMYDIELTRNLYYHCIDKKEVPHIYNGDVERPKSAVSTSLMDSMLPGAQNNSVSLKNDDSIRYSSVMDSLDSIMPFGKYKDKTIEYILDVDAGYIIWASDKVDKLTFSDTIVEMANNAPKKFRR